MRRNITTVFLVLVLLVQLACGPQINRAISIAKTVPGILASLPIPNKQLVIDAANTIISGLEVFKDNPTRSNLANALEAVEKALNSGIFNFNPLVLGVFQAVRVLVAAIVPNGNMAELAVDRDAKVETKDLDSKLVDDLDAKVKALKASAR